MLYTHNHKPYSKHYPKLATLASKKTIKQAR